MKAAVIGAGFIGKEHLNALKLAGIGDLIICDPNEESIKFCEKEFGAKPYTDYKDMLTNEKPDFVIIGTPTHTHYPIAKDILEAKVPLLCEKPFCSTVEQAEELINIAKEKDVHFMIAHALRFVKPYVYLKQVIESKRYGNLLNLNMFRYNGEPANSQGGWIKDKEKSGGAIMDLHIHETDMALMLVGKPDRITTAGTYDHASTIYHYDNKGVVVSAQTGWIPYKNGPLEQGFELIFENAYIFYDGAKVLVKTPDEELLNPHEIEEYPEFIINDNPWSCEDYYFASHLEDKNIDYCPLEDSKFTLKTVFAEIESFKTKNTVKL